MSRIIQAAFTISPNSPPPEVLRQIRGGMFQALADSWDEFMRSPQFLEGMRQWMENAVALRKLSNEFLSRMRTELQAPSRGDIDSVMLTVRHMEKRLLDRLDELLSQVAEVKGRRAGTRANKRSSRTSPGRARKGTEERIQANGKARVP